MKEFFYDNEGNVSMMRLKTLIICLAGVFLVVHKALTVGVTESFIISILSIGLGAKIWQKYIEKDKGSGKAN